MQTFAELLDGSNFHKVCCWNWSDHTLHHTSNHNFTPPHKGTLLALGTLHCSDFSRKQHGNNTCIITHCNVAVTYITFCLHVERLRTMGPAKLCTTPQRTCDEQRKSSVLSLPAKSAGTGSSISFDLTVCSSSYFQQFFCF